MNVKEYDAKTTDYNITYYTYSMINKIRGKVSYYQSYKFEADKIIDGIYLGSIDSVYDEKALEEHGITHIISAIAGFEPPYPDKFKYIVINALDSLNTDLSDNFDVCNNFIENALNNNGKVLIHCVAGRSRSVTILCAYIIYKFGIDVKNALDSIRIKRNIIEPNPNFIKQLFEYYNKNF